MQAIVIRLAAAAVGVMGLAAAGWLGPRTISESSATKSWPSVEGVIDEVRIDSDVRLLSTDTERRYRPVVSYTYEVNGETFTAARIRTGGESTYKKRTRARRELRPWSKGQRVTVWYDPADPSRAVLETGGTWRGWAYVLFGVAALGASVLGMLGRLDGVAELLPSVARD